MKLPKILDKSTLKDCIKGESLFNVNGLLVGTSITHEYYKIYCILQGKGEKITDIAFPFLFYKDEKQFLEVIKIGLLAEKVGIKYIDTGLREKDGAKILYLYQDPKMKENAVLISYLLKSGLPPSKTFNQRMVINQLYGSLRKLPEKYIRGNALFIYYRQNGFSPKIKKAYLKKHPQRAKTVQEELERKYNFIKKYDNFKDFNEKYNKARKQSLKYSNKIIKDSAFLKYRDKTKPKKFKFPLTIVKKSPLYSKYVHQEVEKFKKDLLKKTF